MKYFAFLHANEVGLMRSHCSTRFFLRNTSSGRVGSRNWSVGCTVGGVVAPLPAQTAPANRPALAEGEAILLSPFEVRTEGDVGHGARSLSKSVEETADTLAFFSRWTGLA